MTGGSEFKFLELKISGLSDHCKVALNKYLDVSKPSLCFLNETRTFVERDAFDHYIAECSHDDRGVAFLLLESVSCNRIVELEILEDDGVLITVLIKDFKRLAILAYIPTNPLSLLELWLSQVRRAQEFAEAY